jgi:hypothetical protein
MENVARFQARPKCERVSGLKYLAALKSVLAPVLLTDNQGVPVSLGPLNIDT